MVTQCTIMLPIAAVFTVKEHMLLRIIIYLFQFLLCVTQVILAYCHLWNRLRQQQSIIDLTTIRRVRNSHYHLSNPLSTHRYNNVNNGLYLPNQPCLWRPVVQHLWLPHRPPPGNHWFPPLSITCLVHCHHIPTAKHLRRQPKGTTNNYWVPQGRACSHQDAQTAPRHVGRQRRRTPLPLWWLAHQHRCQLGRG